MLQSVSQYLQGLGANVTRIVMFFAGVLGALHRIEHKVDALAASNAAQSVQLDRIEVDTVELRALVSDLIQSQAVQTDLLQKILATQFIQPGPAVGFSWEWWRQDGTKVEEGEMKQIKTHQSMTFEITPRDKDENVTTLDGNATVQVSDSTVLALSDLSADGLSGTVSSLGKATVVPGVGDTPAQISVSGDAMPGSEIVAVGGSDEISVLPGNAINVTFEFGTPTDTPPADDEDDE